MAFIDLDGFKAVNDGHGHDAGDEVLRQMGARLRDAVRPRDDVARYGGDEFVIVCRQASVGAEPAVTERVERILVEPIRFTGGWWQPAASIGMARATVDDDTSSLLRRADHSMYDVKRSHHAELRPGAPLQDLLRPGAPLQDLTEALAAAQRSTSSAASESDSTA